MRNATVAEVSGRRVIVMDSISLIADSDAGAVIISGSHGGKISGAFAALHPPALVIFNDAGGGKANAGRAAITYLDERGIACATVSHLTARIGDAEDAWRHGTLSDVGETARRGGLAVGQTVANAVKGFAAGQVG